MTGEASVGVDLATDALEVTGRIVPASNATFAGRIGDVDVVYKPIAGERPLWDFPDGTLADREVAACLVSTVFGGDIVPPTWLRDGPYGPGMVQRWCESDAEDEAVAVVPADALPAEGWRTVLHGHDERERPVALIHEDSPALRRMAVFDVLVNNADRKGGHILATPGGQRRGVDHGLTFHHEPKLRTVLWGWRGEPLDPAELAAVARVREGLAADLGDALATRLTPAERDALAARCDRLLRRRRFPAPHGAMPAIPWPPW